MHESDRLKIEWCIKTIREIADLGRDMPLGDLYPEAVLVVSILKQVIDSWQYRESITEDKEVYDNARILIRNIEGNKS